MSQINITVCEFIDTYSEVIGSDSTSKCSFDIINRARIIAWPIGDWVGTIEHLAIPRHGGRFILPSRIEVIKEAYGSVGLTHAVDNISGHAEFMRCCGNKYITKMEGRIYSPFQLTEKKPMLFRATNLDDEKVGLRVQYVDHSGSIHDETVSLLNLKGTRLRNIPAKILRISKPTTKGLIEIRQGGSCAYIDAFEKAPSYTVYCIEGEFCGDCVMVRAKKKLIPYTLDDCNQILDINPEALSSFIVAVKAKDRRGEGWVQEYAAATKLGHDFLQKEIKNEVTVDNFVEPVEMLNSWADSFQQA